MTKRTDYHRKYNQDKRFTICSTIRGNEYDQQILNLARKNLGLTWLQMLYRGAGIKRPDQIKL